MGHPDGKRSGTDGSISKIFWKGSTWRFNFQSTTKAVGKSQPAWQDTPLANSPQTIAPCPLPPTQAQASHFRSYPPPGWYLADSTGFAQREGREAAKERCGSLQQRRRSRPVGWLRLSGRYELR